MVDPFATSPRLSLPDLSHCPGVVTLQGWLNPLQPSSAALGCPFGPCPQGLSTIDSLGAAWQISEMAGDWQILLGEQWQQIQGNSQAWWARVPASDRLRLWAALQHGSQPFLMQWISPTGDRYCLAVQVVVQAQSGLSHESARHSQPLQPQPSQSQTLHPKAPPSSSDVSGEPYSRNFSVYSAFSPEIQAKSGISPDFSPEFGSRLPENPKPGSHADSQAKFPPNPKPGAYPKSNANPSSGSSPNPNLGPSLDSHPHSSSHSGHQVLFWAMIITGIGQNPSIQDASCDKIPEFCPSKAAMVGKGASTVPGDIASPEVSSTPAPAPVPANPAATNSAATNPAPIAHSLQEILPPPIAAPAVSLQPQDYLPLFAQHPTPVWVLDWDNYQVLEANQAACVAYGYTAETFQRLTLADLHNPEDWQRLRKQLERSKWGQTSLKTPSVWQHWRQDGSELTVALHWTVVPLADRSVLLLVARDISEQVLANSALWQSHQRYASLVNSIDGIVWEFDLDTLQFTFVNEKAREFLGYPVQQWLEEPNFWVNHVHPDDQDWVFTLCRQRSFQSESRDFEYRMISATNQVVWLRDIATLVEEKDGQQKLRGIMVNVTEQKEHHALLRQYEKIVSTMNDSIALVEPLADGSYVYRVVNQGYLNRFQLKYGDIVGHRVEKILGKEFYYQTVKGYLDRCCAGETVQYETWFEHPTAGRNFLSVTYSPYQDDEGQVSSIVVSVRDLTDLKEAETALLAQAEREHFMLCMMNRIRNSLSLETILETTVAEVRQMLGNDRVLVCCFFAGDSPTALEDGDALDPDHSPTGLRGKVVAESVAQGYPSLLHHWIQDPHADRDSIQRWEHPNCLIPSNPLYPEVLCPDLTESDTELGILSALILPIITQPEGLRPSPQSRLWGYLMLHHYQYPRSWRDQEVDLLQQLTEQLAIAIHQSELYGSLAEANQQLQYWADHDALTHVANRRFFNRYIDQEWRRLSRERGPISLILCDVDYFKAYNDTYGHVAGDLCLQQVAQTLANVLKRPADLVARYGGEEFVLVLPQTDSRGAIALVHQIQETLAQLQIPHQGSRIADHLTLSFGIASAYPSLRVPNRVLIKQADTALYRAKQRGRNGYDLSLSDLAADPLDDRA